MELFEDGHNVVPMTILAGFLGAGKTTLLNRILEDTHGLNVAVMVNDFGSINIDADLVVGVEDNMISLANGCVCCQIRDDLIESVEELINGPQDIEYILLEASGVAEPAGIAITFTDPAIRDRVRLDSITCVVDAEQAFAYEDYPAVAELKLRQIAFSDMVILNKIGLAGNEQIQQVHAWIADRMNNIRIVETNYCEVPYEILLGVGRFDPTRLDESDELRHHGEDFSTWSYETHRPLSLEKLQETVRRWPAGIYRCKGFVNSVEEPDRRAILQVVGRRMDITLGSDWSDTQPHTRIVVIGAPTGMDSVFLTEQLETCVVTPEAYGNSG